MTQPSYLLRLLVLSTVSACAAVCQDTSTAAKVPLDHVIGTITAIDANAKTITVTEDKTNATHVIQIGSTKSIFKVEPGAKDLKSAVRITASDLEVNDRVDVRGTKAEDNPDNLNARSVILMSGRALAATHEEQAAAWAKASSARVTAVDAASGKITADTKAGTETKSVTIQTAPTTEFSRYSVDTGKPGPSKLADIQPGDQLKIVGDKNDDGTLITAQKIYSGAFRTISITVSSLGADGKSLTGKDLASKKPLEISLNADATIHKLPAPMAAFLARRLNPSAAAANGAGNGAQGGPPAGGGQGAYGQGQGGQPGAGGQPGPGAPGGGNWNGGQGGAPGGGGPGGGRGDISQMIARTPTIALSDLKPGDALVISGVMTSADNSHFVANTLIAGVEPILQAAPTQRNGGRSAGGDWGLGEMTMPQQ